MASLTLNNLFNAAPGGVIANRPVNTDADFRDTVIGINSADDNDDVPSIAAGDMAPGDHWFPFPWACNTPLKMLKWLLDRVITEQSLTANSPRVARRGYSTNSTTGVRTVSYTVTFEIEGANLEELEDETPTIVEPDFTYPS